MPRTFSRDTLYGRSSDLSAPKYSSSRGMCLNPAFPSLSSHAASVSDRWLRARPSQETMFINSRAILSSKMGERPPSQCRGFPLEPKNWD